MSCNACRPLKAQLGEECIAQPQGTGPGLYGHVPNDSPLKKQRFQMPSEIETKGETKRNGDKGGEEKSSIAHDICSR